jgi:NADH:ubiquinone oxidoreductase subunit 2 (subunit N)
MTKILSSASKIVFIVMALAVVAGLFTKVIDPKDFMVLASMAFTFYFANKGEVSSSDYAGK